MNEIEDMLRKKQIDNIKVPDELESRLRKALDGRKTNIRRKGNWQVKVASILVLLILTVYNIDTLAYYGKKIIGYDGVMNGTLKQLNMLGKGQEVGKSYTFKNGVKVTLDGVMLDDNQMLLFYTVKNLNGKISDTKVPSISIIEGIGGRHNVLSGQGLMNEDETEIKWIQSCEVPYFFEKKLRWKFSLLENGKAENGEIVFILDRNEAMSSMLKKNINKSIKVDETDVKFESIVASPTTTKIKGTMQNLFELATSRISGEGFRPGYLDIRLIANGEEVEVQGSGMSTDLKGMKFSASFDALPSELKTLQIKLVSFAADHDANKKIKIEKGQGKVIDVLGQRIEINDVYEEDGETFVKITTEESIQLSKVHLIIDGNKVGLEKTIKSELNKKLDGTIYHTRTLRFKGTGKNLELEIQRMIYNKVYNETIDVPID